MNDTTKNAVKVVQAGKACGTSAPLWHVVKGGEVVGTITEVFPDLVRLYLNGAETWHSSVDASKAALQ